MVPERAEARVVRIAHLYPDRMDLYGDGGNVLALKRRCEWRGIRVEVVPVPLGVAEDFDDIDLVVMGGGQDTAQTAVAEDLQRHGAALRRIIDDGAAALVVCGGFQLFGTSYTAAEGETMPGIGVFDAQTVAGTSRLIGNISVEATLRRHGAAHAQPPVTLVGFENHSGRTRLAGDAVPLGRVVQGGGNLGDGTVEGAVYRNAIGTYLHGPVLPKNPRLADHLLVAALAHRYGAAEPLASLDDIIEMDAHHNASQRCWPDAGAARSQRAAS